MYKEKQRVEVGALEAELARARARLADTSRAYEQHVRALTAELWAVGEKFLAQRDHAAAARRAARSASLMSLQHVHSVRTHPHLHPTARVTRFIVLTIFLFTVGPRTVPRRGRPSIRLSLAALSTYKSRRQTR